jgi:hypothetical protein
MCNENKTFSYFLRIFLRISVKKLSFMDLISIRLNSTCKADRTLQALYNFMRFLQHCFTCRPSDPTVSEDAGIEPRTAATLALTI